MQLSSKASPVVLKPFTNVHSPFWHSSFQHLTHTLPKSPGTNTDATTTSNLVPLLTACCLVVVHHCPVCISPSPLSAPVQSSSCAIHLSVQKRSRAAPPLFPASILLPPWQNVRAAFLLSGLAVLGQAWLRQGAGKSHAGGVQEQRKVSKRHFTAQLLT